MVNRVTLIGNLGRDPEIRTLETGVSVAKFSVATNENYKDKSGEWQKQTEWHEVVAWRDRAEQAKNFMKKGVLVYVEGKLVHRKWQDKDGNDRYNTEVVANYMRVLKRPEGMSGNFPSAEDAPPQTQVTDTSSNADAPESKGDSGGNGDASSSVAEEVTDATGDDLPF